MHPQMDFEKARFNMVEQQVRTWDVLDQTVLDLLFTVRRENFVPPAYRALAFTDMEIPLRLIAPDGSEHDSGETMWSPKMEARIVQELGVKSHENVLEIGTGSGYLAALLAHKAQHVVTVEVNPMLAEFGAANLARGGVRNVRSVVGDAARGWAELGPYDIIVATDSLPAMPPELPRQLRIGGRMAVIVGDAPAMSAEIITRVSEAGYETLKLFETNARALVNAWRPSAFRF